MTAGNLSIRDVYAARDRIQGHAWRTPLERSAWLSERARCDVFLKLECWQQTGSFKIRGAFNAIALLSDAERARGIVTASAGNHGQGVALAAARHHAHATVFVPRSAPAAKKSRISALGATLDESAANYDEAEDAALQFARDRGSTFVNAFSDAAVVAGQGTVGIEILEDLPGIRTVIVPVGGGGLIAGIATVLRPETVRIVGVQSSLTYNMHAALAAGRLVECPIVPTLADGLAGRTDEVSLRRCQPLIDDMLLVPESALEAAIRSLFTTHGVVAEGAGAVGAAAIDALDLEVEGPVAVVITGRNLDAGTLARILGAA